MNFSGQKHSLILLITDAQVQLLRWQSGELSVLYVYGKTPEDVETFAEDIKSCQQLPVLIVTDLGEENFRYDTVVHVSGGDQRALLKRKMDFAFRNTPYRRSKVIEREKDGRRDDKILLSAISKPEAVDVWASVLLQQKFAIQTITSTAYILETFVAQKKNADRNFLLISNLEHGNNLRQTFFKNGQMVFSRLTTLTGREHGTISDEIYRETTQLRQYFERTQFLSYDALLCIEVYTSDDQDLLQLENRSNDLNRIDVLDTSKLAAGKKKTRASMTTPTTYFLSQVLAHRRPANVYAPPSSTKFHDLKNLGYYVAFGAGMILLLTIAINIPVAFNIREQQLEQASYQNQLAPLRVQYDALMNNFPALPVSSQEMELVVTTHDKLATQIYSPVTAMNMISAALATSPGLKLTAIDWALIEKPVAPSTQFGSLGGDVPVQQIVGLEEDNRMLSYILEERTQIKIVVEGQSYSPSSFREAQDEVVKFVTALSANSGLTVYASRMPTDVRTDISVSTLVTDGEIRAPFTLELTLVTPP
ncbi:MAG: hypothetical protein V4628_11755 [Pseudomonadota bacterium]